MRRLISYDHTKQYSSWQPAEELVSAAGGALYLQPCQTHGAGFLWQVALKKKTKNVSYNLIQSAGNYGDSQIPCLLLGCTSKLRLLVIPPRFKVRRHKHTIQYQSGICSRSPVPSPPHPLVWSPLHPIF